MFEFYRTTRFDAKSYPVTIAGTPKEHFVQHNFGGSVSVESEPGQGAAFKLRLPLARMASAPSAQPQPLLPGTVT